MCDGGEWNKEDRKKNDTVADLDTAQLTSAPLEVAQNVWVHNQRKLNISLSSM